MKDLLKIILGRKLPQKKLEEIRKKRDFTETLDDFGNHKIAYLVTGNGIKITEDRTKILNKEKGAKEYIQETRRYTPDGLLLSSEILGWSSSSYREIFPPLKTNKTIIYNSPGSLRKKAKDHMTSAAKSY